MIFWGKIVIFHTKYPKKFRASLRNWKKIWFFGIKSWFLTRNTPKIFAPPSAWHNFFKCAPPPNFKSWIHPWILSPYFIVMVIKITWKISYSQNLSFWPVEFWTLSSWYDQSQHEFLHWQTKKKKLLHTEITMIEYDENVVHGLGQAHRCGRVKIVTDEKNNTDINFMFN